VSVVSVEYRRGRTLRVVDERRPDPVEQVVRGFAIAARSWDQINEGSAGTSGGTGATWERAVDAVVGLDAAPLALLLWCNGVHDDTIHAEVLRAMMKASADLEARLKARPHGRAWPRGMVSALAGLAVWEMRPAVQMRNPRVTDTDRRARIGADWPGLPACRHSGWCEEWKPRYLDVLAAGRELEADAGEWIRRRWRG
jgi:hypothetical protein